LTAKRNKAKTGHVLLNGARQRTAPFSLSAAKRCADSTEHAEVPLGLLRTPDFLKNRYFFGSMFQGTIYQGSCHDHHDRRFLTMKFFAAILQGMPWKSFFPDARAKQSAVFRGLTSKELLRGKPDESRPSGVLIRSSRLDGDEVRR
jgi:hypothetical protein